MRQPQRIRIRHPIRFNLFQLELSAFIEFADEQHFHLNAISNRLIFILAREFH